MTAAQLPDVDSNPPITHPQRLLSLAVPPSASVDDESGSDIPVARPNIADPFGDLLAYLDPPRRLGMISWLATRYYDGWRPDRAEIVDLVGVELGVLLFDEAIDRRRRRATGLSVPDILPRIQARFAARDPDPANPVDPRLVRRPTLRSVVPTGSE